VPASEAPRQSLLPEAMSLSACDCGLGTRIPPPLQSSKRVEEL